jgi:hypothetical protein
MTRRRMNGPRSLIRTVTLRPLLLFVTRTRVPKGSVRCAAVRPFRLSAFATGSTLTRIGVHGSDAGLGHSRERTPNENHCAAGRGSETHKHSTISPIVPSDARSDRTRTCVLTAKVGPFLDIAAPGVRGNSIHRRPKFLWQRGSLVATMWSRAAGRAPRSISTLVLAGRKILTTRARRERQ